MLIMGISCGFHDCGISVIADDKILFAAHAERYSKVKHDENINDDILKEALSYGEPDIVAYYEKPLLKKTRQLQAGQYKELFKRVNLPFKKVKTFSHHLSHAAAGFQTSPFDKATVVVIDAIGEFDTITIWAARYKDGRTEYKKLWSQKYPNSIGLFYSSMTKRVGLKPLDEEYIMMGMAAWGKPIYSNIMKDAFIDNEFNASFKKNLHKGIDYNYLPDAKDVDIAASTQWLTEELICNIMLKAKSFNWSDNLVYMGGVALNCLANNHLGHYFKNIWIMPNPGDAGSSLGAAALAYGKKLNWKTPFLGHNITGKYPIDNIINELLQNKIVGVASGRAEFGPRALGNRSLLADPRGVDIKDKVNAIKQRQEFRPFAPSILEEHVHDYFDMPHNWNNSRYMQTIAICRNPDLFPAIVHRDGTSRVHTVPKGNTPFRKLLEKWHKETGCPMLLNTSLNIRGEPIVNNIKDAKRFEKKYGVKVFN